MGDSSSKPDNSSLHPLATFEVRLAADPGWALSEGSQFFEGKGAVQIALQNIARRLKELGVPYAVAGGMALFQHGYRRFTEDVDILVTREGLKTIHKALDGRGYVRPFAKSKNLRDTAAGVKIEFLLTGDYPGDGKPKAIQFPDPQSVAIERDGIRFLNLSALIELKLASGMTGSDRMKDLADVQELIKLLNLPLAFDAQLSGSVRERYGELWRAAHARAKRYVRTWRTAARAVAGTSLQDLVAALSSPEPALVAMCVDGVTLDAERSLGEHLYLVTTDPLVAERHGMMDEAEFMDDDASG